MAFEDDSSDKGFDEELDLVDDEYPVFSNLLPYGNNNNGTSSSYANNNNGTSSSYANNNNGTSSSYANNNNGTSSSYGNNNYGTSSSYANNNNGTSSSYANNNNGTSSSYANYNNGTSSSYANNNNSSSSSSSNAIQTIKSNHAARKKLSTGDAMVNVLSNMSSSFNTALEYSRHYHTPASNMSMSSISSGATTTHSSATALEKVMKELLTNVVFAEEFTPNDDHSWCIINRNAF
jgi:hypothetical protein